MKQAMFAYVNHAQNRSWNQPVLSIGGKVSCSRKQRSLCWGLNSWLTGIHRWWVRHPTYCAMLLPNRMLNIYMSWNWPFYWFKHCCYQFPYFLNLVSLVFPKKYKTLILASDNQFIVCVQNTNKGNLFEPQIFHLSYLPERGFWMSSER